MLKYHLWRIRKSFVTSTTTTLKYRKLNIQVEQQSTNIVNAVGYVILIVVLLNYGFLLSSARFFDSNWVHSTAGSLVENGWGLLLGFMFVFYRCDQDIVKPKEFFFLKLISWAALAIGIGYFLIAPLVVTNAFRIDRTSKTQIYSQIDLADTKVKQYVSQLNEATPEQLTQILKNLQASAPESNLNSERQLKETLLTQARQKQEQTKQELQAKFSLERKNLFATTIKWSMTAILTGMCFLLIWRYTTWARIKY